MSSKASIRALRSFRSSTGDPFFDLRVLMYLLAIPPLPWCDNKEVLRSAMAGSLPDAVRSRRKHTSLRIRTSRSCVARNLRG